MKGMPNPQIEFAFAMGLGSVAAICGAKFNAYTNQYSGLNINMTVVADTGFGLGSKSTGNEKKISQSFGEWREKQIKKHVYTGQKGLIEGLEEDLKNLEAQRRKAFTNKEERAYRDWETDRKSVV